MNKHPANKKRRYKHFTCIYKSWKTHDTSVQIFRCDDLKDVVHEFTDGWSCDDDLLFVIRGRKVLWQKKTTNNLLLEEGCINGLRI